MVNRVFSNVFPYEAPGCCLECQFLYQPNPGEDVFVCLRTLDRIMHEIDGEIECCGFEEMWSMWVPEFIAELDCYV